MSTILDEAGLGRVTAKRQVCQNASTAPDILSLCWLPKYLLGLLWATFYHTNDGCCCEPYGAPAKRLLLLERYG